MHFVFTVCDQSGCGSVSRMAWTANDCALGYFTIRQQCKVRTRRNEERFLKRIRSYIGAYPCL